MVTPCLKPSVASQDDEGIAKLSPGLQAIRHWVKMCGSPHPHSRFGLWESKQELLSYTTSFLLLCPVCPSRGSPPWPEPTPPPLVWLSSHPSAWDEPLPVSQAFLNTRFNRVRVSCSVPSQHLSTILYYPVIGLFACLLSDSGFWMPGCSKARAVSFSLSFFLAAYVLQIFNKPSTP